MEMNTRERILQVAVKLFAKNGYAATSMSDIAKELGVSKPALYKHYKSKQEIFDSILERMSQMDYERAKENEMPEGTIEEMTEKYVHTSMEQVKKFSIAQFDYWTQEEFACAFRRMLTLEQYRSPEMMKLYQQYLCEGPVSYMADIFRTITGKKEQATEMAVNFYAPMFLLYSVYDAAETVERKEEIKEILKSHLEKFSRKKGYNNEIIRSK